MGFSFFRLHLSKLLRLSYLVLLHLSRKIISVKPQPLSRNSSDEQVSCTAAATRKDIWTILNVKKCYVPFSFVHFDFATCFYVLFDVSTSKSSPKGPNLVFGVFWLRDLLRGTTACTVVHCFDIATAKSGPRWSEPGVFCAFWLGDVLRATTACHVSSLIWPADSAPIRTRRFSEPAWDYMSLLFDPPEPQIIIGKNLFRDFLTFSYLFRHLVLHSSSLLFFDSSHL